MLRIAVVICLGALVTACGNLQTVKLAEVPAELRTKQAQLSTSRPTKETIGERSYEIPNRSLFFQQTSGGSAAVGILFGPLGVLANMANIDRITKEMGESGKGSTLFELDALAEASKAWETAPRDDSAIGQKDIKLKPYIVLFVSGEKEGISTLVGVRAEGDRQNEDGTFQLWAGHYNYVLVTRHKLDVLQQQLNPEEARSYRTEIQEGFKQIRRELSRDLSTSSAPRRQIAWVKSPTLGIGGTGAPGDIDMSPDGRLALRVNMHNYGPLISKATPYAVSIFPSASQYSIENGPVDREGKK